MCIERQRGAVEPAVREEKPELIQLTDKSLLHLSETRKWALFVSVFYMVVAGLLIFSSVVVLKLGSGQIPNIGMISLFGLVSAVLVFVPILFLVRFCRWLKNGVDNHSAVALEEAFKQQKLFFISTGIMVVLSLIFLFAFVVAGLTLGLVSSTMQSGM